MKTIVLAKFTSIKILFSKTHPSDDKNAIEAKIKLKMVMCLLFIIILCIVLKIINYPNFTVAHNVLRYEHVAGFGALLYQTTPKLDARLKAK
jgi:hypothetical protein